MCTHRCLFAACCCCYFLKLCRKVEEKQAMTSIAAKRIAKDFQILLNEMGEGGSAHSLIASAECDNFFRWKLTVRAPSGTIYSRPEGANEYLLLVEFPEDYPHRAPHLSFLSEVYSPLVGRTGVTCERLLSDEWAPDQRAADAICRGLRTIFCGYKNETRFDVNTEARHCLADNPQLFEERVRCIGC
uniref:Putative ubiquitin-protein ligase n=1 Tax=Trypanosoma congolense (strain IL3000) TaxID=1068625 RepID=G0ULB4_TRYCI|nr:putative ubiquitin-protein ligase [Trypanosoma congolense IL3000]